MKTLQELLASKNHTMEAFGKMSAEEQANIYNELNAINRDAFKALKESNEATKDQLESFKAQMESDRNEQFKNLNEALKAQGLAIKKLSEGEKVESVPTIKEALTSNIEKLKNLKDSRDSFSFEVKAAGTMTISGNVSGGNIPVEDRIEGLNVIPSRRVRLLDIMSQRSTTSNVVSWVYQANKDGAAGQTAEGTAKNQIDYDLVVTSESIKKTTAYIKVSTEMLDDIEWIESEIRAELLRELLKAVENTTYSGNGVEQAHNGLITVASAFAAGALAGTVDNANEVDVLAAAITQINIAQEGSADVNYILMNPLDVYKMKTLKVSATDRRYVERVSMIGGSLNLDGVPILETTLVTAGKYLVGDFMKAISVTRSSVRFEVGVENDDFTKNLRTILAEWRGATIVKNNDRSALVYGDFATDKAALETT